MAHQLAYETLAQVLKLYLRLSRHEQQQQQQEEEQQQQQQEQLEQQQQRGTYDAVIIDLCQRVGAALAAACAEREQRREDGKDSLREWVASIAAKGCPEVERFWEQQGGS